VEVVHARCAGLDISKRDAKVCVRVAGAGRRKTSQILALREHLPKPINSSPSNSPI
jgi:transposase